MYEVIGIRFKKAGKVYFFDPNGIPFAEGESAVVETARGVELGHVVKKNHMEEEKQTLTAGTRANAIDYETRYALQYTIQFLDYQIADLGRSGSLTNSEAFQRIKVKYDAGVANHKAEISRIKERLKYLFAFADEVFGDGQEMLILVTELTVRYYCGKFITKFGCDEYFKHNQNLMFYERKKELLSEIASLTEL